MAKVFISYARKDKEEVYPIVDMLEKNGIDCWIDKDGIESGDQFKKVIITAINECNAFIYMLSDNAIESEWVGKEYGHAKRKEKRIIPVFLKGATQNDEIMFDWDQIDYVDTEKEGWQEKLLKSVKKICDNDTNLIIKNESQHVSSENNTKTAAQDSHEYVDLGLPSGLLWATCNIGATKPEETGDFFAWGEFEPKENYTAKYSDTFAKLLAEGVVDFRGSLKESFDTATVNWGKEWRMPTIAEFEELIQECSWTWTSCDGVDGYKVASKKPGNKNYIFFPTSGVIEESSITNAETDGVCWTSNTCTDMIRIFGGSDGSFVLSFDKDNIQIVVKARNIGVPIRPVRN